MPKPKPKTIVMGFVAAAVLSVLLSKIDILQPNEESILKRYCKVQEYDIKDSTIPANIVIDKKGNQRVIIKTAEITIDMPLTIPGK